MGTEPSVDRGWWDDAYTRQGHTGWADEQVYGYDQPLRRAAVETILRRLHPGGLSGLSAIDIGCGTGDFTAMLYRFGAGVLAFDFSKRVVDAARRRFAGMDRVRVSCASATAIPAPDADAAVVTCVTVLQHLTNNEDVLRAIREIRRVLRHDGRAIVLELAPPLMRPRLSADGHVIERPPGLWQSAFEASGLLIEREAVYPQYGIAALRLLAQIIDRLRGSNYQSGYDAAPIDGATRPTAARASLRAGLWAVRKLLLAAARPFDHWLFLPVPRSLRYYRLWVLKPSDGGF